MRARIARSVVFCGLLFACGDTQRTPTEGPSIGDMTVTGVPVTALRDDTISLAVTIRSVDGAILPIDTDVEWSANPAGAATFQRISAGAVNVHLVAAGRITVLARWKALDKSVSVQVADYPRVSFDVDSVTFSRKFEARSFRLTSDFSTPPELQIVETRAIATTPVISRDSLARGRIVATGRGRALIVAGGVRTYADTIVVNVDYADAVMSGWRASAPRLGDGDTLWILGTGLEQLQSADIRIAGFPADRYFSESTRIAVKVPTRTSCNGSALRTVEVTDAHRIHTFKVGQQFANELQLQLHRPQRLTAHGGGCVRLPPPSTVAPARYALIFVHAALLGSAQTTQNPYIPTTFLTFAVRDVTTAANSSPNVIETAGSASAPSDAFRPAANVENIYELSTALKVGDTVSVNKIGEGGTEIARVQKIYGGYLAVLMPVAIEADFARIAPALDSAMAFTLASTLPTYPSLFLDSLPRTGQTEQFAIVLRQLHRPDDAAGGRAAPQYIDIDYAFGASVPTWVSVLAHELGHAWHFAKSATPGFSGSWEKWNVEGLATFLQYEMLRKYYGCGFEENIPPRADNQHGGWYYHAAINSEGTDFIHGYDSVSAYLRDLVWVLMRLRHYSQPEAMRFVLNGVANGWYGCSTRDCTAVGLAEVMKTHLGDSWDPADSMMDWTAAQILDELASDPRYQIPSFGGMSYIVAQNFTSVRPLMTFTAGTSTGITPRVLNGSTGLVELRVGENGAGVLPEFANGLEWKIVRIQ